MPQPPQQLYKVLRVVLLAGVFATLYYVVSQNSYGQRTFHQPKALLVAKRRPSAKRIFGSPKARFSERWSNRLSPTSSVLPATPSDSASDDERRLSAPALAHLYDYDIDTKESRTSSAAENLLSPSRSKWPLLPKRRRKKPSKKLPAMAQAALFSERVVHFDMKGAPPRVAYLAQLFKLVSAAGATGVLLEYEDMFPFEGTLKGVRSGYAYSKTDIAEILSLAKANKLAVIPLVQTFGHLEWMLKDAAFADAREDEADSQSICPSRRRSWQLLTDMLDQVLALHPDIDAIHIGADEARYIGRCEECASRLNRAFEADGATGANDSLTLALAAAAEPNVAITLEHIARLADYVRQTKKVNRVLVWNDMFGMAPVGAMQAVRLAELVEPVVWGYKPDVSEPNYFPDGMFERYGQTFKNVWIGTAFKGANGPSQTFVDESVYHANHESFVRLVRDHIAAGSFAPEQIAGAVVTGWQRFDHFGALCELLPEGTPSLVSNLVFLDSPNASSPSDVLERTRRLLNCSQPSAQHSRFYDDDSDSAASYSYDAYADCQFAGARVYEWLRQLERLRRAVDEALRHSSQRAWFSPYHVRHAYSSVWMAREVFGRVQPLVDELVSVGGELRRQLSRLFFDDSVDEWLFDNVQPHLDRLRPLLAAAERVINASGQPVKPLGAVKLEL